MHIAHAETIVEHSIFGCIFKLKHFGSKTPITGESQYRPASRLQFPGNSQPVIIFTVISIFPQIFI